MPLLKLPVRLAIVYDGLASNYATWVKSQSQSIIHSFWLLQSCLSGLTLFIDAQVAVHTLSIKLVGHFALWLQPADQASEPSQESNLRCLQLCHPDKTWARSARCQCCLRRCFELLAAGHYD